MRMSNGDISANFGWVDVKLLMVSPLHAQAVTLLAIRPKWL